MLGFDCRLDLQWRFLRLEAVESILFMGLWETR